AFLDLTGSNEIKSIWKGSTTLPCVYVPVKNFVLETLTWTVVHDQSSGAIFRRDGSGDHVLLSEYRGRISVLKDTPGNLSLHILNLEISDRGTYTCQVTWRASNNSLVAREITTKLEVVKDLPVAVVTPESGVGYPEKNYTTQSLQRSHLSLFLVILIAILCSAVVFVVIFLIICIRKPKD
ncbi:VSIG4 protein, partial [Oreotrochilus melanogaster]|nr:VSIG4 protein [Oreotrochilus melanogaster]